jgi:hypothetical protein
MQFPREIIGVGPDLLSAIQHVLDQLLDGRPGAGPTARVQAIGASAEELVSNLLDQVADTADSFAQVPASVVLDGLRAIEDGRRIWGVLTFAADGERSGFPAVSGVAVSEADGMFQVHVRVDGGSVV